VKFWRNSQPLLMMIDDVEEEEKLASIKGVTLISLIFTSAKKLLYLK
jgi:hypothetical protein